MISSDEYIQIVSVLQKVKTNFTETEIEILDELRDLHKYIQNKLEDLLLDEYSFSLPETRTDINELAKEIIDFCRVAKVVCKFNKIPEQWIEFCKLYKNNKTFVNYYYNEVNVNDLIVFTKKKSGSSKKQEVLTLEKMEELLNDTVKPENDIPGTPLEFTAEEKRKSPHYNKKQFQTAIDLL